MKKIRYQIARLALWLSYTLDVWSFRIAVPGFRAKMNSAILADDSTFKKQMDEMREIRDNLSNNKLESLALTILQEIRQAERQRK